eukprot:129589_1
MSKYKLLVFGYIQRECILPFVSSKSIPNDIVDLCLLFYFAGAYGVPIYNKRYYDCAEFNIGEQFDMSEFAMLCLHFAVMRDLKITRVLRRLRGSTSRRRECVQWDASETGFHNSVDNNHYRQLFHECFGYASKKDGFEIDLRDYCGEKNCQKRENRPFVLYDHGFYIKKDMVYRLCLLMRLVRKHIAIGLIQDPRWIAPWDKCLDVNTKKRKLTDEIQPNKKKKI